MQSEWTAFTLAENYDRLYPVLDPNNILTQTEKNSMIHVIEEMKTKKNVNATIAFIDEMANTYAIDGTKDIRRFADEFIKVINKGNSSEEANTLVVLYSINDRLVRITPGLTVATFLSVAQQNKAIYDVKDYLRAAKYGTAGIEGLKIILQSMLNDTPTMSLSTTDLVVIIVVNAVVVLGVAFSCFYFCWRRVNNYLLSPQEKILFSRIKEISKDQTKAKAFREVSCPICLADLVVKVQNSVINVLSNRTKKEKIATENIDKDDNAHQLTIILECRHAFHRVCFQDWLEKSQTKKCPICRKETSIDKIAHKIGHQQITLTKVDQTEIPEVSQEYQHNLFIRSLVDIQTIMHPHLKAYSFRHDNNGFDYCLPNSLNERGWHEDRVQIVQYPHQTQLVFHEDRKHTAQYHHNTQVGFTKHITHYHHNNHGSLHANGGDDHNYHVHHDGFFQSGFGGFGGGGCSGGGDAGVTGGW